MTELMIFLAGCVVGLGWSAYRLKGSRTWPEVGAVIFGGGGPSNESK